MAQNLIPTTPEALAVIILSGSRAPLVADLTVQFGGDRHRACQTLASAHAIASQALWDQAEAA